MTVDMTYPLIQGLIVQEAIDGDVIVYTFQCPLSGARIEARHDFGKDLSIDSKLGKTAKKSIIKVVSKTVVKAAKAIPGPLGKTLSALLKTGIKEKGKEVTAARTFSAEQKQEGALLAFGTVADRWLWDGFGDRFVAASEASRFLSNFQQQLARAPLESRYDRNVAARVMIEVAGIEQRLAPAEEDVLRSFLDVSGEHLEVMQLRPPLTDAELSETEEGEGRCTLTMLAWVLALSTGAVSARRADAIRGFADRLGVANDAQERVAGFAREYVLEQVMEQLYVRDLYSLENRDHVYAFASQIGMKRDQLQSAEARYLKRQAALSEVPRSDVGQ